MKGVILCKYQIKTLTEIMLSLEIVLDHLSAIISEIDNFIEDASRMNEREDCE